MRRLVLGRRLDHTRYSRAGRPAPRPGDHRIDRLLGSLQHCLYGSIGSISDPAIDAALARFMAEQGAVTHALHEPAYTNLPCHHAAKLS